LPVSRLVKEKGEGLSARWDINQAKIKTVEIAVDFHEACIRGFFTFCVELCWFSVKWSF